MAGVEALYLPVRRFLLLLLCFPLFVFGQQVSKLDSLKRLVVGRKDDTSKVTLLVKITTEALKTQVADSVLDIADQALKLAAKLNYPKGLGEALTIEAQAYNRKGNFDLAIRSFNQAYHIFDSLGILHSKMNVINSIGNVYLGIDSLDKAYDSYTSTLKIATELHDTVFMAIATFGLGNVDLQLKNYDDALESFNSSYEWFKQMKHANTFAALIGLADCYREAGDVDKALKLLLKEEKAGVDNMYFLERMYFTIGSCYLDKKNYKFAIGYYEQAMGIDISQQNYYDAASVASHLVDAYEQAGNFKEALRVQKLYITYNDSVFNDKFTKQFSEFEGKFQNEKRRKEIELLNKDKELTDAQIKQNDAELSNSENVRNFMVVITVIFGGSLFISYRGYRRKKMDNATIQAEKKKSDELLLNIIPADTAEELKSKGYTDARGYDMVTVLFTDFKGFSSISEKLSPQDLVRELNDCFSWFDEMTYKYRIEKIKTIGDAYMAAGGLPKPDADHAARVVNAALEMRDFIEMRKQLNPDIALEMRIGIHTGPVVAGIVGVRKFAYDIWGDTVNTAARMESSGEPGKVNVSQATYALLKDKFHFEFRGKIAAKGKGDIEMYFVEPLDQMNSCPVPMRN